MILGFGGTSAAQESDSNAVQQPLEEIIVTATRREERLQSVPLSVSVVTGEEIRALGAAAFADYARTVPGLSFTDGGSGGEKQTIRGISSNAWSETNSPTAVHLDNVPITNSGGVVGPPFNPDPALIDINRVEVLQGPQGTLFGAGSMGGAIHIVTNTPNPETTLFELETTITSIKNGETGYGVSGVFNVPLAPEDSAIRAVVYRRDPGGFIDNVRDGRADVNNREISGARLAGLFKLSERVSVTAKVAHQQRKSDGFSHEQPLLGEHRQSRYPELIADEWRLYNLVVDIDYDWGQLLSSTSYLDREVDTVPDVSFFLRLFFGLDNPLHAVNNESVGEFVQDIRLVSDDDGPFNWLAGIFYQDHDQDISQDFLSPGFDALMGGLASMFGPPDNLFVRRERFSLQQLAVYGEASYEVAPAVEVSVGGRWYDIDRDYHADNMGLLFIMGSLQEAQSAGDTGFIPRLSLKYTANEKLVFFASVAEGFRPGGINPGGTLSSPPCVTELQALGFTAAPTSYLSDSLVSYEIGTRYQSPGGGIRMSAAAYHIDWSDMQTQKFLNCGSGFIENAGAAVSKGLDFELLVAPLDSLELVMAAGLNNAELSEDVPNLGGTDGDRIPGVPRITARVGARMRFPLFAREAYAQADVQYVGNSYVGFTTMSPKLPPYTIVNLRLGVDLDNWSAAVFVNNVADEDGALFINDNPLGQWLAPIRPRTVGLNVNWRF